MPRKRKEPRDTAAAQRLACDRPAHAAHSPRVAVLGTLGLLAAVAIAYVPAYRAGFVWDDDAYVTDNPTLRSLPGLARIWFEPGAVPQYYPLVHTLYWVEYHLWGLNPVGYHTVNVGLHGLVAVLLWRLLTRLKLPGAWVIAALFAVHPVQVESVAWVTERKNTLSGLCYLAAMLAYLRFRPLEAPSVARGGNWRWYAVGVLCFLAALLSKSVTVTLIPALLVLVWWRRGRVTWRDVWPLIPLVILAIAVCPFSMRIEHGLVRGDPYALEEWQLSLVDRVLVAGRAFWFYIGKLLWPAELAFCYDRWRIDPAAWWQYAFPAAAVLVTVLLAALRKRTGRGPLVAVVLFALTLSPALGFVNYYPMRYSFVADHFQYLASIAMLALFVATARALGARLGTPVQRAGPIVAGAVLLALGVGTWRQCRIYENRETLWRDTLDKRPDCYIALNNLGNELANQGRFAELIPHLEHARQVRPANREVLSNLANAYGLAGRPEEALQLQLAWLQQHPDDAVVHYNVAVTYYRSFNQPLKALEHLRQSLALEPDFAPAQELVRVIQAAAPATSPAPAGPRL